MPENHIGCFNTMELISNKTCYKGTGLTDDDLARPIIGIACSYNDSVPGHTNLQQLAEQVKFGVYRAGRHAGGVRRHRLLRRRVRQPLRRPLLPALSGQHCRRH